MPPRQSNTLTEAELRIMKLLWERGESTVAELAGNLSESSPLAYNSVLTTVRILERKGYVDHRQDGRAFVYACRVAEHEASRSEIRHVLNRFFGNSRQRLLLSLLGDDDLTAEEIEALKRAIGSAPSGSEPVSAHSPEGLKEQASR